MRVALFITCFNDTLFPEAGRATVALLERLGCEVEFPLELLRQLGELRDRGVIDRAEFEAKKAELLDRI